MKRIFVDDEIIDILARKVLEERGLPFAVYQIHSEIVAKKTKGKDSLTITMELKEKPKKDKKGK